MNDAIQVKGIVTIELRDSEGNLKQQITSNAVTNLGLGCIADILSNVPGKQKFDTAHTYIVVGTGNGSVSVPKSQTWVYTQVGSPQGMSIGYPQSGTFPNPAVTYSAVFSAGTLNATGINEACLVNSPISGVGQSMAYAPISPSVNVALTDSLSISWTITFS